MKPRDLRIFVVVATCLCSVLFLSGCATPKMEAQLLKQCILRGDSEGAVKLISNGVLDSKDNGAVYGDYLFYAAQKNDTNVMLALFARGADMHHRQPGVVGVAPKRTAVHAAAQARSAEALKLLIDRGGNVMDQDAIYLTPFDLSVLGPEYGGPEYPGVVTDMLIEAGARPREKYSSRWVFTTESAAGTHWAMASYEERRGELSEAISSYQMAPQLYERVSQNALGLEKFTRFLNSPIMRSALVVGNFALGSAVNSPTGVAVNNLNPSSTPFDPLDPKRAEAVNGNIASLHDKAERYAVYSKLLADHAKELISKTKK
jgi:hypothetical protein